MDDAVKALSPNYAKYKHIFGRNGDRRESDAARAFTTALSRVISLRMFVAVFHVWDATLDQLSCMVRREHIERLPVWWVCMTHMDYAHNDGASRSRNRNNPSSIMHSPTSAPWMLGAETYEEFVFTVFTLHVVSDAIDSATLIWGERNDTYK